MATKRLFTTKKSRRWTLPLTLLLFFLLMSAMTQVGGLVVLFCLPMIISVHRSSARFKFMADLVFFLVVYLVTMVLIVPNLAPIYGRVSLPWMATEDTPVRPVSLLYCLLGRNYVRPGVKNEVVDLARKMSARYPGTRLVYYDAGFPFWDDFPMIPHLGHRDGNRLDLAFFYRDRTNQKPVVPPSPVGYFAYEQPQPGEERPCQGNKGWLRWELSWLQSSFDQAEMDPERTAYLLGLMIDSPRIQKILMEPHLTKRLKLQSPKIAFQGCLAPRHDDHIHLEFADR